MSNKTRFWSDYCDCIEPLLQFHCSCTSSGLSVTCQSLEISNYAKSIVMWDCPGDR